MSTITIDSLREMMSNSMLWITEDVIYHHNADVKSLSLRNDNVILHTSQPNGSHDITLPLELFKKLVDGERVTYNRYTYSLYDWKFPFNEEEEKNDD